MPTKFNELLRKWHNGALHGAQIDLARKLKISQSAISQWVNGYYEPEMDMLEKLSKEFKLSVEEIKKAFVQTDSNDTVKDRLQLQEVIDVKPIPVYGIMVDGVFKVPALGNTISVLPEEYVPMTFAGQGRVFALRHRGERSLPIPVMHNEYVVFSEANSDDVNDGDLILRRLERNDYAFDTFDKKHPGNVVGKYVGVFRR